MPSFVTRVPTNTSANFFTSGGYDQSSFSVDWATKDIPDVEDIIGDPAVYLQVLSKFNIPTPVGTELPPGGQLPGIDLRNMDAIQSIRLSLAEALLSNQWWELYEDGAGGVFFQKVFDNGSPGATVNLTVRQCVPSVSKSNQVDMVIVRGYDKPPQRFIKDYRTVIPTGGDVNPDTFTDKSTFIVDLRSLVELPHSNNTNTVVKSFPDPLTEGEATQFGSQVESPFYEVKAFEELIGFVQRVQGMPESNGEAARVSYRFSDTTEWYQRISLPNYSQKTLPNVSRGFLSGGNVVYFESTLNIQGFNYTDRYGDSWPLSVKPTSILVKGYKIQEVAIFGEGIGTIVFVDPIPQFFSLNVGTNWVFEIVTENSFNINVFHQPNPNFTPGEWGSFLSSLTGSFGDVTLKAAGPGERTSGNLSAFPTITTASPGFIGHKDGLGVLTTDIFLGLEMGRPSVNITDTLGDPLTYAQTYRIDYAPIVIVDEPQPVAYRHRDESKIVDFSQDVVDHDPTTAQDLENTDSKRMQDLSVGNIIDINLPFCKDGDECLTVANTIFDYQNYSNAETISLTCSPDDDPQLGAAVAGFNSSLRIESITYSYQDGSAYNIEVSLGPVFSNIGSWNNGAWIPRTENITREAIITYTAGDGANYGVRVQGLGHYAAINRTSSIWRVGERVQVELRNVLVERE